MTLGALGLGGAGVMVVVPPLGAGKALTLINSGVSGSCSKSESLMVTAPKALLWLDGVVEKDRLDVFEF